jgi:N12 class adenine-specific DNA methylase
MGMKKTMQQFQIEWHNLSSSGRIKTNESGYLPDVVKHNEELSEKMKLLESEVDRYRKSAEYILSKILNKKKKNIFFYSFF